MLINVYSWFINGNQFLFFKSEALKDSNSEPDESAAFEDSVDAGLTDYPFLLMGCLRLLLENNPTNATMFHECGGARCIHDIVPYSTSRTEALKIIRELILAGGNDDLGKIKIEKWI